ncbi:hypothetical protein PCANC_17553 [Puccinia coronata f. sp. avenae]|uniref:Uncharacterized protein n=1 Tax=Puccinia coronata f. sp. avenae TaxID=200324 RepID=A0A2N5U167_9BASI|nr:hypothetical protein PCANC_21438 [Puccinia coronata f. sp. avenae]PLW31462.1 hypothetical protein PCANC_17553 [Puccinia coronata f. sp. avenae]
MPNFGDINKELAKECKEETSSLKWNQNLIATLRGHLQRSSAAQLSADLSINIPRIVGFQATVRGARCRRKCRAALKLRRELDIQRQFSNQCGLLRKLDFLWTALQAHARRSLVRARRTTVMASAIECERAFTGVQALVRARLMTQAVRERKKRLETVEVASSVVKVQSQIRGLLERQPYPNPARPGTAGQDGVGIDGQRARRYSVPIRLSRRAQPTLAAPLHPTLTRVRRFHHRLPSLLRKTLVQRAYARKAKALNSIKATRSVGGLQAFVRAGLIHTKIVNQKKELDFIQPGMVGIQAPCRGVLARLEWRAWFLHLHFSVPTAIFLHSLTRGFLVRRNFFEQLMHYHNQMDIITSCFSSFSFTCALHFLIR